MRIDRLEGEGWVYSPRRKSKRGSSMETLIQTLRSEKGKGFSLERGGAMRKVLFCVWRVKSLRGENKQTEDRRRTANRAYHGQRCLT